jgi:hypothetical protein
MDEKYKIVSEDNGIVIVDKNCSRCGIPLRLYEYLDYTYFCDECNTMHNAEGEVSK